MRVIAARSAILAENDSRVRVTAWRMRLKKPPFFSPCSSGSGFSGSWVLPKRVVNDMICLQDSGCDQAVRTQPVPFNRRLSQSSTRQYAFAANPSQPLDESDILEIRPLGPRTPL